MASVSLLRGQHKTILKVMAQSRVIDLSQTSLSRGSSALLISEKFLLHKQCKDYLCFCQSIECMPFGFLYFSL